MTELEKATKDFDSQEASNVLAAAQTKQLADYRHDAELMIAELEKMRGDLARLTFDLDAHALRLQESEAMVAELSRRCEKTNDDAYGYLNDAAELCDVLRKTMFHTSRTEGALMYLAGIFRFYREKFHAPNYGDDIPF